jgi:orotate phosphoribosyltransferase
MEKRGELAKRIYDVSHITGEFILRSGVTSNEYFDKYLFEADPELLKDIVVAMKDLLPEDIDALAGLEMGGIPVATMLSQVTGLPALFVRKKAKEYGTCKFAEGGEVKDRKLVIIEDVVTSGGQIILSVKDLRKLGAKISVVLCVFFNDTATTENLAKEGLEFRALFKMSELKES